MFKVIIEKGARGREKILRGASKVGELVGMSLGPKGRTAIIKTKYSAPQILHDGKTIAQHIMLEDDIEDLGAQTLIEGAMKTDDRVGDGTTTATIIASKIVEEYAKKIKEEDLAYGGDGVIGDGSQNIADVNRMAKEIIETGKFVIEKLEKMAKPLKKNELKNVVSS